MGGRGRDAGAPTLSMESRRFPSPWTVEGSEARFIVKDHAGLSLAYVYF
jgi:hypothetical protein